MDCSFPQILPELGNKLGPSVTVNCERPVLGKTFLKFSLAVSLAASVMVFEQGTRMASLVRLQMKFTV